MLKRSLLFLCCVLVSFALHAQGLDPGESPFSSRLFPDVGPSLGAKALAEDLSMFVSPLLLDTEGLRLGRISSGLAYKGFAIPFRISLGYTYLDPEGADSLDQYSASLTSNVLRRNLWGLTLSALYSDTRTLSHKKQVGASGELKVGGQDSPVSIGADLNWAKKGNSTGSVDDIIPVAKVLLELGKVSVGSDYTFDNNVDGEDDYSAELNFAARDKLLLAVGAGKHSTVFFYAVQRF